MSYIVKSVSPFVSIKLTSLGRQSLSSGLLNFASWAIGDSELNYVREAIVDANPNDITLSATSQVLRPFDNQPNIKYFITPFSASTPFQTITNANLNVIQAIVNNQAETRGFFSLSGGVYTTLTSTTYSSWNEIVANNISLTGGTILKISGYTNVNIGDWILLKVANNTSGTIVPNENTRPLPNLWFQAQSIGVGSVTVDRKLPNYSASTAHTQVIVYRGGEVYNTIATGNTTAYWDSGTLQFDGSSNVTCNDVPVWNMNNVWCESLAGITGLSSTNLYEDYTKFGSFTYLGDKNPYFEYLCQSTATTLSFDCNGPGYSYPDDVTKSISIIHYTNNTISNLYGEFLYVDTTNSKMVQIYVPDLMYSGINYPTGSGITMGMRFLSSGTTQYIGTSNLEYIPLIEDVTLIQSGATPNVIGKVFPQLKIIVIDDDEIVAALSYKSNRNWTLPPLAAVISSPSGGTSTGVLGVDKTIYLTYSLENNSGNGLTPSLPCQNYTKLTNSSSSAKDVSFRISETDLLPYMRKIENAGYDGLGFYATKFKLMYQIMDDSVTRPDPGSWKVYDFTTTGLTTTVGGTIDPKMLEVQTPTSTGFILDTIKDSGSTTFNLISMLNMAPNNQPTYLQFGDERFFYGNLDTYIGATIYKTIFDIRVSSSQFNTTSNPTMSQDPSTNPPNIKISEVGIYDNLNNLVCIGKLSTPVALISGESILIELSLDF